MMRIISFCSLFAVLFVPPHSHAAAHTWKGGHGGLWSNPLNWIGGCPVADENDPVTVLIPSSAAGHQDLTNDIPGLALQSLRIEAHANTLHAAAGVVTQFPNATIAGLGNSTILAPSFTMEPQGVFRIEGSNGFIVRSRIQAGASPVTLEMSGNVTLDAPAAHHGATLLSHGTFRFSQSLSNTAFIHIAPDADLTLAGDATIVTNFGRLSVSPESMDRPETSRIYGRGLVCAPGSTTSVMIIEYPAKDSTDPADGGRLHSHLVVDGPVRLGGRLEVITDVPQGGSRFTIIENTTSQPTIGTFEALPEGALMRIEAASDVFARISYRGGDGNDVTLTLVEPPAEKRIAGPWILDNGLIQLFAGTGEFNGLRSHHWEFSADISSPSNWARLGSSFMPGARGALLTVTNLPASSSGFFRLVEE